MPRVCSTSAEPLIDDASDFPDHELDADATFEFDIQLVEKRAAAGQVDAAVANVGSTTSGGRSSNARWMNSAISATGPASASAMCMRPQHMLFEPALPRSRPLMWISTCRPFGIARAPCPPRS